MSQGGSIFHDPDFRAWEHDVVTNMLPKLAGSAASVSLVPTGPTDAKFAVELGFSIMLDKPILAIVGVGQKVPEKLRRVADMIVVADPATDEGRQRIADAIPKFMAEFASD